MGLFSSKKEGGMMDYIRTPDTSNENFDLPNYLIWKWRPFTDGLANTLGESKKENSLRWGSPVRVKQGEIAIFLYQKKDGTSQEVIDATEETKDIKLDTANFPILAGILGLGFNGETPFPAEVYFINMSRVVTYTARVPYFDVFDPRFIDFAIKCAVQYQILTQIRDYKEFINIHRLANLTSQDLFEKMKPVIARHLKSLVINIPKLNNIAAVQIETQLDEVNFQSAQRLNPEIEKLFGIQINNLSIDVIDIDKEDEQYFKLRKLTADINERKTVIQANVEINTVEATSEVNIKNLKDSQQINADDMIDRLAKQREEMQRAQRLQTESSNFETHKLNIQTDAQKEVLKAAADSLGDMGTMNLGGGSGGGMNPAGMMTGMMMGGAMGNQMAGMMNQMGNTMNPQSPQNPQMPPPPPMTQYLVSENGQQAGPFNMQQLQQMVMNNQLQLSTYVWKQGMQNWVEAGQVLELQSLFNSMPPPPPPPPMP
jgi:membrane protease subunit (stomatin/prohibitin family)